MAAPNSRGTLIDYCKRKLGDPVIEINVDDDQIDDRIDEALAVFYQYHSDATVKTYLKHLVTAEDVSNEYITIPSNTIYVSKLFPVASNFNSTRNFFDIKYQMMLNDMSSIVNFSGELAYYQQMQQYLSLLDTTLNGHPQVNFSVHENRLYIFGDFADKDIVAGDYIIAEVYKTIDPNTNTSVYNNRFVREYATALIKQQWGQNLIKFEGMQLPGGVTMNGRQLYDDATSEIKELDEKIRLEYELPPDFFVG